MAAPRTGWDNYFSIPQIQSNGEDLPRERVLNFIGAVGSAVHNVAEGRIDITLTAIDGVPPIDNAGTGQLNDIVSTSSGTPATGIRFSGAAPTVTGIASGALHTKKVLVLFSVNGPLVLAHQNAGSAESNRIVTPSGTDVTVPQGGAAVLIYDGTTARWRVASAAEATDAAPITNSSTGTIHDVASTSSGTPARTIRFTGAAPTVTGIASGFPGRRLVIHATGGPVVLANENVGSSSGNRIITGTGSDVTIADEETVWLVYDGSGSSGRWRLVKSGTTPGTLHIVFKIMTGGPALEFAASGSTIERLTGSFLTDGFAAGDTITIVGSEDNDGTYEVVAATATVLTVGSALVDEEAIAGTVGIWSGGHISYGLPGGTLPNTGLVRIPSIPVSASNMRDIVLAAMRQLSGVTLPILAVNDGELQIGGTFDDANDDAAGVTNRWDIGLWANFFFQRSWIQRWGDDSGTDFETRWIETIETTNATPTQIPRADIYGGGQAGNGLRVHAEGAGESATWVFVGTDVGSVKTLVYEKKSAGASAWNCTSGGLVTGAASTTIVWTAIGGPQWMVAETPRLVSPILTGTPKYLGTRGEIRSVVTEIQTEATTQVNCGTLVLDDDKSYAVDVVVMCARRTSNTKRGRWKFSALVSRSAGGIAVLDQLEVGAAISVTGGTATCDVDGANTFRVRVTPADADGRNYMSEMRIQEVTDA